MMRHARRDVGPLALVGLSHRRDLGGIELVDFVDQIVGESLFGIELSTQGAGGGLPQKLGFSANGVSCSSCVQQDLSWVCR